MIIRLLMFAGLLIFGAVHAQDAQAKSLSYSSFSQIPVLQDGRVKPLDSFARLYLQVFSRKKSLPGMDADAWLAELLLSPENARRRPVFHMSNPDVTSMLGLERRKSHLYSFYEVTGGITEHAKTIGGIYQTPEETLSIAQRQVKTLYESTFLYIDLMRSLSHILPDFAVSSPAAAKALQIETENGLTYLQAKSKKDHLQETVTPILDGANPDLSNLDPEDMELILFAYSLKDIEEEHRPVLFRIIPPQWNKDQDLWHTPWQLMDQGQGSPQSAEFLNLWTDLARAYRDDNPEKFSAISKTIKDTSLSMAGERADQNLLNLEVLYNSAEPFTLSLGLYIFAFLLFLLSTLSQKIPVYKASLAAFSLGLGAHATGIILRMMIMQRPPVTSLYESILFVGLITVIFSLILEWRRKDGYGLLIGVLSGMLLQFIGLRYGADGDTLSMLQAVLDTNFWLATHVVTITIGYGCCLVAGLLAHLYVFKRLTRPKDTQTLATLYTNIQGIALVALFFATLGTILGGIWADQSWGRFWGWDPKENGALLICLWLIWLMHGRLAGMIAEKGFVAGMILTNVIVALAWFGVNLLGVGLHSYGFTQGIVVNLSLFCGAEILIAALGYVLMIKQTQPA